MENKQDIRISKVNKFASWIDDFLVGFIKKNKDFEKVAENQEGYQKNLEDFPKVNFEGEEYYIITDDKGSYLVNKFNNPVPVQFPGIFDPEEVVRKINEHSYVINKDVNVDLNLFESEYLSDEKNIKTSSVEEKDLEMNEEIKDIEKYSQDEVQNELDSILSKLEIEQFNDLDNENFSEEALLETTSSYSDNFLEEKLLEIKKLNEKIASLEEKIDFLEKSNLESEKIKESLQKNNSLEDNNQKEDFEILSGKEESIFQSGICPYTNKKLIKSEVIGDFIGVYSEGGEVEYAVNLNDGTIYKYNLKY
jgi:hypothetical protein